MVRKTIFYLKCIGILSERIREKLLFYAQIIVQFYLEYHLKEFSLLIVIVLIHNCLFVQGLCVGIVAALVRYGPLVETSSG